MHITSNDVLIHLREEESRLAESSADQAVLMILGHGYALDASSIDDVRQLGS